MDERRAHPRKTFASRVDAQAEERSFLAAAGDISAGGMLIFTANPVAEGQRVELRFVLPGAAGGEHVVRVRARVVRVVPSTSMGVAFENLSAEDRAAIEAFARS